MVVRSVDVSFSTPYFEGECLIKVMNPSYTKALRLTFFSPVFKDMITS